MAHKTLYELTPEHRAQLEPWRDRWIANAMSTKAMDDGERAICREAVVGLYEAAGLKAPPPERIVFVPSPLVLRLAGGFAAAIWHSRKTGKSFGIDATGAATWDATWAATRDATWDATGAATEDATEDATWAATRRLSPEWHNADPEMLRALAAEIGVGQFGLQCAYNAGNMWAYGNQDSGYDAFLSFFQDIAKLRLDYSKYRHWRALAEHSGPRIMHAEFCMISDRPEVLLVDAENRPHCDDGPFCRWRDGFSLWSLHGLRVSQRLVEAPESYSFEEVRDEPNAEVRRWMLDRFSGLRGSAAAGAWLAAGGLKPISQVDITDKMQPSGLSIWRLSHGDEPVLCKLYRAEMEDDEPLVLLWVVCTSTAKEVFLRVPPDMTDAAKARDWTFGASLAEAVET